MFNPEHGSVPRLAAGSQKWCRERFTGRWCPTGSPIVLDGWGTILVMYPDPHPGSSPAMFQGLQNSGIN